VGVEMVDRRHRRGRRGELIAVIWLQLKGYRLLARNWAGAGGELDLVMRHRGTIVFVEVKARASQDFGGALGAVGRRKQERMARAAAAYLSRFALWQHPTRFDVVAIERGGPLAWRLRHVRDAFQPDLGRLM
jgi:putative endonuclease